MITETRINDKEWVYRYVGYGDFDILSIKCSGKSVSSVFWAVNSPGSFELNIDSTTILIASGNGHWDFHQSRMFGERDSRKLPDLSLVNRGIESEEPITVYVKIIA